MTFMGYLTTLLILICATWSIWHFFKPRNQHSLRSVAIVVLGDIGRSPRMMYHAQSFAEINFMTDVVGYGGSKPIPALERLPKVRLHYLPELPGFFGLLPFILIAPIKVIHQAVTILHVLLVQIAKPPEFILVQNPPTIPTLALVWLVGRMRGCKVIIDWHNLGYTILALKVGDRHLFVKIASWFEEKFGRTAYAHLFVTHAMHDFLVEKWNLQGHKLILHDRPPSHFHRSSSQEIHELFLGLHQGFALHQSLHGFLPEFTAPYSTPFTYIGSQLPSSLASTSEQAPITSHTRISSPAPPPPPSATTPTYSEVPLPRQRPDRPALLVSSTSWTPDEDFGILLEALKIYDTRAKELAFLSDEAQKNKEGQGYLDRLPKLLVIVTGKGPLRVQYMMQVEELQKDWEWVKCISLWLEAEDYPTLLGSADLGVSLHSSSSSLDLPMKVVDMFGCKLPVCALDFACLHELVKDGVNGLLFKDSVQLAEQLEHLFTGFPHSDRLDNLRLSLIQSSKSSSVPHITGNGDWYWGTWEEKWTKVMKPLILSDLVLR